MTEALQRPDQVEFAHGKREVAHVSTEAMLGGFGNGGYNYEVITADGLEAGFYLIPAGLTTRVVKVVQEGRCVEKLVQGAGWFLKIGKNGIIEVREFDAEQSQVGSVFYKEGDTIVWGAKKDMRVLTFADRPFTDEMEIVIERDGPKLPREFWDKYDELIRMTKERGVIRPGGWEEIFPDRHEADKQYQALLADFRNEYTQNNSLASERVEQDQDTDLGVTVFEKTDGNFTAIQRLPNGNVRLRFVSQKGEEHVDEIVPSVGNIRHGWNYDQITALEAAVRELPVQGASIEITLLSFYLRGKPASPAFEKQMLDTDYIPQRVGYKIYPDRALQRAQELTSSK
ncbi:MAG: hypothetical protein Q7S60_04265 [bacterium]|nr:hypothetical protein [bacterium]